MLLDPQQRKPAGAHTDGSIFISYRREDASGESGRLAEHLERRFGKDRVFIDIDKIAPGADFVGELGQALTRTAVVIVVIGRQWLTASKADGTRRLDDPADFVRREIETALQRDTRVIPVLVQNVSMPAATELPTALAPLASRQAMSIQHEEFSDDVQRLADAIAPMLGTEPQRSLTTSPVRSRVGLAVAIAGLALLTLAFFGVRWQRASTAAEAAAAATRIAADSAQRAQQRAQQQAIDDLVKVATDQRDRLQFADAMTTLDRAITIPADAARAKALQEDLAMQWIRDLRVSDGQTFGQAMVRPLAVLDRAAPFARGARQGDLLAHLGWAMYLRWRDGDRALKPVDAYNRALAADSLNPFANAFLGHWWLSHDSGAEDLARARQYFTTALRSGREAEHVRRFQLAALNNDQSPASRLEIIRVMNDMRLSNQALPPNSANSAWSIYYFALNGQASQTVQDLMEVLPPAQHLETYRWAFSDLVARDESKRQQFRFYTARLNAELNQRTSAVDSLRVLRKELANRGGMLHDAVDAAITSLSARSR